MLFLVEQFQLVLHAGLSVDQIVEFGYQFFTSEFPICFQQPGFVAFDDDSCNTITTIVYFTSLQPSSRNKPPDLCPTSPSKSTYLLSAQSAQPMEDGELKAIIHIFRRIHYPIAVGGHPRIGTNPQTYRREYAVKLRNSIAYWHFVHRGRSLLRTVLRYPRRTELAPGTDPRANSCSKSTSRLYGHSLRFSPGRLPLNSRMVLRDLSRDKNLSKDIFSTAFQLYNALEEGSWKAGIWRPITSKSVKEFRRIHVKQDQLELRWTWNTTNLNRNG